jgi:hypothetical protein
VLADRVVSLSPNNVQVELEGEWKTSSQESLTVKSLKLPRLRWVSDENWAYAARGEAGG